jgi:hypothetical protein
MSDSWLTRGVAALNIRFMNGGSVVYAEFTIQNKSLEPDQLKSRLTKKFGAEDRTALQKSVLFGSPQWDDKILYATEKPNYLLFAVWVQDEEHQITVEPVKGNLVDTCQSVWRGVKRALKSRRPKLFQLKLVDSGSMEIMKATTSKFRSELGRSENISPVIVGVVAAIYAFIGWYTFASKDRGEFLAGAIAGVAAALVALVLAFTATRKGKLSWKVISLL